MLCINLKEYSAPCTTTVGGVNRAWIFDPSDFNFTAVDSDDGAYSAIALRVGSGAAFGTAVLGGSQDVVSVPVTTPGSDYPFTTIPLVFTGGGGTGATGYAQVVGGAIVGTVITAGGSGYTTAPTVTLSTSGATLAGGAKFYAFDFYEETGEYTFDNPESETCSTNYTHTLAGQMLNLSQGLSNFMNQLSQAGCCCGLGVVFELNNDKSFVMGEKYVNNIEQKRFKVKMTSNGGSGQKYEDFNGATITFTGKFLRPLNEVLRAPDLIAPFQ